MQLTQSLQCPKSSDCGADNHSLLGIGSSMSPHKSSSLEESVNPGYGVGCNRPGTGVHPLQRGERTEHHHRMRTWEACREAREHSEHDSRKARGGAANVRGGEGRCRDTASVARAPPTPSVPVGEPLKLGTVGTAGGHGDPASQWVITHHMGGDHNRLC